MSAPISLSRNSRVGQQIGRRRKPGARCKIIYDVTKLIEWARGEVETNSFKLLVDAGLLEYTGEFLVAR
jgi:hypothetical protein